MTSNARSNMLRVTTIIAGSVLPLATLLGLSKPLSRSGNHEIAIDTAQTDTSASPLEPSPSVKDLNIDCGQILKSVREDKLRYMERCLESETDYMGAMLRFKQGLEQCVTCITRYYLGYDRAPSQIEAEINLCESNGWITPMLAKRLHKARKTADDVLHERVEATEDMVNRYRWSLFNLIDFTKRTLTIE